MGEGRVPLPLLSGQLEIRAALRLLLRLGCEEVRQKGSHARVPVWSVNGRQELSGLVLPNRFVDLLEVTG